MFEYIRQVGAALALSMVLVVGACGGDDEGADTSLVQDTALSRDLELAGRDTAAQPQLSDVPANTGAERAPATTRPRSTASSGTATRRTTGTTSGRTGTSRTATGNTVERGTRGSEQPIGTLPAGTEIVLSASSRVCTNTNKVGDKFTATVREAVSANGVTVPAGATAVVTVTRLDRSDNANDPIIMEFAVNSISYGGKSYPVSTQVASAQVEKVRTTTKGKDAQKVIGGAVIGAVAGQVIGKDTKSTVIGAATGAAAGTAAAVATANYDGCVPEGGRIAIRLTAAAAVGAD